ncbi:hypothetical protein MILUP08_43897 [Micromonospora lupini str. Lupac 08]|uniref:Uncharacterized protein n=1 Tax=Micromonospora lupini str. Lupac 08 TaxID=1150864 RepID=I0L584_9ACTN|nr:hypothetical protein MILUP08_43897 [Micromonospora lupini str. Lupac 08]
MPPRRRPRRWLAGRLRSAAGAVQRLAGRVETTGVPAEAPRRLGEPPAHWLNLVAAHAPGLLRELDLDPSHPTTAWVGGRDDHPGWSDADDVASTAPRQSMMEGQLGSVEEESWSHGDRAGLRAPGTATQPDGRGDRSGDGGRGGRSGRGGRGDRSGDGGGRGGEGGRNGRGGRGGRGPGAAGLDTTGGLDAANGLGTAPGPGTAIGLGSAENRRRAGNLSAAGWPGAAGGFPTVGGSDAAGRADAASRDGRPTGEFGRSSRASGATGRPGRSGIGGALPSDANLSGANLSDANPSSANPSDAGPSDAGPSDAGPSDTDDAIRASGRRGPLPASSDGSRLLPGRLVDGWRRRDQSRRDAAPQSTVSATPAHAVASTPRGDTPSVRGLPPGRPSPREALPREILEDSGPSRGTFLPRSTADGGGRAAGGGWWPDLPGEPARPGGEPGRRHAEHLRRSHRAPGATSGRQSSADTAFRAAEAAVVDPWPELPDDGPLWTVPGAGLDAPHVDRLDREQAGD